MTRKNRFAGAISQRELLRIKAEKAASRTAINRNRGDMLRKAFIEKATEPREFPGE